MNVNQSTLISGFRFRYGGDATAPDEAKRIQLRKKRKKKSK